MLNYKLEAVKPLGRKILDGDHLIDSSLTQFDKSRVIITPALVYVENMHVP